ncbi:8130_t:CDS:2 [Racocetra persica]|uniref:8130_t:CDS:1 n=1 Tax=Racocetra persica TaxID=160502 RepID=A0ACA9QFE5_9GLOM|nr:8130_t:CDS:2 [Racocetra persica]
MCSFKNQNICDFEEIQIEFEENNETINDEVEFNNKNKIMFDSESKIETKKEVKVGFNEKETAEMFNKMFEQDYTTTKNILNTAQGIA